MSSRVIIAMLCAASLAANFACARFAGRAGTAALVAPGSLRTLSDVRAARVSSAETDAAEPAIAAAEDGTAYVAWVEHGAGGAADVRLAHVGGEGKLIDAPARVNPEAGEATAWRGDPPTVAVARDGRIYVGWTARDASAPHASSLELSVSRDGGRTFDAPVKVNDDARPGPHGMHSLAVSSTGRVYVAWLDERDAATAGEESNTNDKRIEPSANDKHAGPSMNDRHAEPAVNDKHAAKGAGDNQPRPNATGKHAEGNRELFFASSSDGGRTFSANRGVAKEVCPCCKTALAVASDGRVYVSWRQVLPGEFRHIAVASTTDDGNSFSTPVVVSDDRWQIAGCPVSGSAIAVAPDGALRVLWYAAGEGARAGLYLTESRDGGRTFSPRRPFAERSASSTPSLVRGEDGASAVVWEDVSEGASRVVVARLDGAEQATEGGILARAGELPAAASAGRRTYAAYTTGENGRRELWIVSSPDGARGGS